MYLAAVAQGYFYTPATLGGGEKSFANIGVAESGLMKSGDVATVDNRRATYVIRGNETSVTVTGRSKRDPSKAVVLTLDMSKEKEKRVSVTYERW
ncbi:MAG: hypothetical protein IH600_18795 [Bacteroidetes bacterium]|nr:hypothetical protein [Bacteroidota bacterium]